MSDCAVVWSNGNHPTRFARKLKPSLTLQAKSVQDLPAQSAIPQQDPGDIFILVMEKFACQHLLVQAAIHCGWIYNQHLIGRCRDTKLDERSD